MSEMQVDRDYKEEAAKLGLVPIVPFDNELQLDIDEPFTPGVDGVDGKAGEREMLLSMLKHELPDLSIVATSCTISKSGNTHKYIKLGSALPMIERIVLQVCLGSDRKREFYNYIRWKRELDTPIRLFERPEEVSKIAR